MSQAKSKVSISEQLDNIKSLWNYLIKRWIIICVFGFGGGALGLLYSISKKPTYESKLSFIIDASSISSMPNGLSGIASTFGLGGATGESLFEGENLIQLVTTKTMIQKALLEPVPGKKISYAEYYVEFNEYREAWEEKEKLKNLHFPIRPDRRKFTYEQDSVLKSIYEALVEYELEIKMISTKVNIIDLKVTTRSHWFSRHFPETLIKIVSDYYVQSKTQKAKINYDVLKHQTDSVRVELYNSLAGLASANDNIFGLNPAYNVQRVPSAKKQVDVQANTAILTELVKNLELARVNLLNNTPLIQVIETPRYPLEEKKLRKLYGIIIGGFLGGTLILGILLSIKYIRENFNKEPEKQTN